MGRTQLRLSTLAILLAALLAPRTASANLLVNGSFELGSPAGAFVTLPLGSTAITGWVVSKIDVDIVGTFWKSQDGARSVDLQGLHPGCLSQTFPTVAGSEYAVSFWLAGNTACGAAVKSMRVSAAGQSADFTFNITGKTLTSMGWVQKNWAFIANSSSTTLEFCDLQATGSCGAAVDNVDVTATTPTRSSSWGRLKSIYR